LGILSQELKDRLLLVMRVYFEKPRTNLGWRGLIVDPHLNDTFETEEGLVMARQLLAELTDMGMAVASEVLDPIIPQYISDLISWAAIGARTTESQTHRDLASGLSMPVGFKNGTDGSLDTAINGILAAASPKRFLGIDGEGRTCLLSTRGNPWGHLILRGGKNGPNYDATNVKRALESLDSNQLPRAIMVDCSHSNSGKDHRNQSLVLQDVYRQIQEGCTGLKGFMLESHLFPGNQKVNLTERKLEYGVSITDACIGWEETEQLLRAVPKRS